MLLLLLSLLAYQPQPDYPLFSDHTCELIEINRVYTHHQPRVGNGYYACHLTQVIYWGDPGNGEHRVLAYRTNPQWVEEPLRGKHGWTSWFLSGGRLHRVTARRLIRTHTLTDPELKDRVVLPVEQRPDWFD